MCNCKNKNSSEKCICYIINKFDELEALVLNMETVEDTNLPRIVSGSLDAETGIATFVRDDATEIPVDLSALLGTIAFIEGTYAEIKAIKDADALIPGLTYIINDYQTEYFIEGSNSSGIVEEKEISSVVSGYAVLNNDYEYDLNVGDTVEVTELPSGYGGTVQVGDTTTVTVENSDYYFRFANNMHNTVGIKFKFFYDRYNTIAQDVVVNDANGKPVLRPQGIINTEVHDGTDYMEQTAAENYAVPVERVVLIASDTNSFKKEGESDTFQGDYLEYDIDDTEIINDNNEVIGTRKGLITRRATFDRSIDAPIDWRVFRFRRWLLDENSRIQFCNRDLDPTTTRVGSGGNFLFESNNRNPTQTAQFYIGRLPEGDFQNIDANAMRKTFQYLAEDLIMAKDFNCFKLDSNYEPVDIITIKVTDGWYNTVLIGLSGEFNFQATMELDKGIVSGCTFVSNPNIRKGYNTSFYSTTFLDSCDWNSPTGVLVTNTQFLSHLVSEVAINSQIENSIFGSLNTNINGMNVVYSWNYMRTLMAARIRSSVIGHRTGYTHITNSMISLSSLFFGASWCGNSEDCNLVRESVMFDNSNISRFGLRLLARVDRVLFKDIFTPDSNTTTGNPDNLFLYDYSSNLDRQIINVNRYDFRLYRMDVSAADAISIATLMTPL